jgi:hypothetical protein
VFESAAALCTVLLVLLVFTNVFIRYSFNLAAMPLKELELVPVRAGLSAGNGTDIVR